LFVPGYPHYLLLLLPAKVYFASSLQFHNKIEFLWHLEACVNYYHYCIHYEFQKRKILRMRGTCLSSLKVLHWLPLHASAASSP
jgi:hypothetical protein